MADQKQRDLKSELHGNAGSGRTGSPMALVGIGFELVALVIIGLYVGQWLDRRFGTAPLFLIVGVFAGAAAGFYSMYQALMASQRKQKRGDEK
jgi:F0F1-type ATP synthase assembly protein I